MPNKNNTEKNREIGEKLKNHRQRRYITQDDMVEFTGMSKSQISAIECGHSKASVEILLKYCEKLNLTPNDILGLNDGVSRNLIKRLQKVCWENQDKILRVIDALDLH